MPERAHLRSQIVSASRRALRLLSMALLALALSSCLLISGPVQSADSTGEGGNVYVGFVSAEGNDTRSVQTSFTSRPLQVTVIAQNQRGQLRVEVLDPRGAVVFAVEGTAEARYGQGTVETDAAGAFRYRVRATGAQRGSFTILYLPAN